MIINATTHNAFNELVRARFDFKQLFVVVILFDIFVVVDVARSRALVR